MYHPSLAVTDFGKGTGSKGLPGIPKSEPLPVWKDQLLSLRLVDPAWRKSSSHRSVRGSVFCCFSNRLPCRDDMSANSRHLKMLNIPMSSTFECRPGPSKTALWSAECWLKPIHRVVWILVSIKRLAENVRDTFIHDMLLHAM